MIKIILTFTKIILLTMTTSLILPQFIFGCAGCLPDVLPKVKAAALEINQRHTQLENAAKSKYDAKILPKLKQIDCLQDQIVQVSVHMAALEKEANLDEKKLIHILGKSAIHRAITAGEIQ